MKVLITDDCEEIRQIYKMILSKHTVIECLDSATLGKEAPSCDLIIADYETFVSFEEVLKQKKPTILVSSRTDVSHKFQLTKPFSRSQLDAMILKATSF